MSVVLQKLPTAIGGNTSLKTAQANEVALPTEIQDALKTVTVAEAAEKYFKRAKDIEGLKTAIYAKIDAQVEFVRWWVEQEHKIAGPGRGKKASHECDGFFIAGRGGLPKRQTISRWRAILNDISKHKVECVERARSLIENEGKPSEKPHGTQVCGEEEWYTPAEYIESARKVMGSIDLDPASSATAQETVKAKQFFTEKDNGLKQEWIGNVWLNPPYSREKIKPFVQKMIDSSLNLMTQGIMLTNSATDTEWFHLAMSAATATLFTRGRISFITPLGEEQDNAVHGQVFFYFGHNANRFVMEYERYSDTRVGGQGIITWRAFNERMAMSQDGTFMSKGLQPNIGL